MYAPSRISFVSILTLTVIKNYMLSNIIMGKQGEIICDNI